MKSKKNKVMNLEKKINDDLLKVMDTFIDGIERGGGSMSPHQFQLLAFQRADIVTNLEASRAIWSRTLSKGFSWAYENWPPMAGPWPCPEYLTDEDLSLGIKENIKSENHTAA